MGPSVGDVLTSRELSFPAVTLGRSRTHLPTTSCLPQPCFLAGYSRERGGTYFGAGCPFNEAPTDAPHIHCVWGTRPGDGGPGAVVGEGDSRVSAVDLGVFPKPSCAFPLPSVVGINVLEMAHN